MIRRALALAILATLSLSPVQAQSPTSGNSLSDADDSATTRRNLPIVAELQSVRVRAANGKLERFADRSNREFAVRYNSDGRVEAVGAVGGRHFSDVQRITYAPTGRILEVSFGSGYVLYFVYADDGTQLIRDRYGGVLTRRDRPEFSRLHSDPAGKLQPTLAGLDAILAAAQQ